MTAERLKEKYRSFLKDNLRKKVDFSQTDQFRAVPPPPVEKPPKANALTIDLTGPETGWPGLPAVDLKTAIARRVSRRRFSNKPLSLEELSFLLWATQGIRDNPRTARVFRTVPSAGCRHALETYLALFRVRGLEEGLYRYLPLSHQLVLEHTPEQLEDRVIEAALGQTFVGRTAVTFIWTTIPYRMEWRYGLASYKVIALDAGHICQNLYLACEAIGAGTCAVAAYDQDKADRLLRVDGKEEFVIYMAPVGRYS